MILHFLLQQGELVRKLMETTGISASTIHKYLGWDKDTNTFATDEYSPNGQNILLSMKLV